jgi:mannose/cellobiose epimerase-like protein (N-acyl-D-glucosamine 2-epimerase family)
MTRLQVLSLLLSLAVPCAADDAALGTPAGRRALADELDAYLVRHVLAPRYPAAVDRERGGFHASFATDWSPQPDRHRFVVYQARMTWTPAAVALARPALRDEYRGYVRHGVAFLRDRMWDAAHGGFHTSVLLDGTPDPGEPVKIAYGQAFAVYALAVAHRATGDPTTLELARKGYAWVEEHYRDPGRPGYRGGVEQDGAPLPFDPDLVIPPMDAMGTPSAWRDMNAHIHLLEAWTELLREWPDPGLRDSTRGLFELVRDRFVAEPGALHLFLDPAGNPVPGPVSFGHDVETAFLLLEAADALGIADEPKTQRAARRLVNHALAWGWSPTTGQLYERGFALGPAFDRSIEWWGQFELVNALSLMDSLYGEKTPVYRDALGKAWRFVRERLTDSVHGGVFQGVDAEGRVNPGKSHDWMATYHTARALLLTSDRLRRQAAR